MGRLSDYSQPRNAAPYYRPHDLVRITPAALAGNLPVWARAVIERGEPVVVRRGWRDGANLPIGIRGTSRNRRHAARVEPNHVSGPPTTPEMLAEKEASARDRAIPALVRLADLRAVMDPWSGTWGIGGAVGYELACGVAACHMESDIDLILRLPEAPARAVLAALAERLARLPVRIDVQLETPAGGVALADWLSEAPKVLIKSDQGPYLAADPWAVMASCEP